MITEGPSLIDPLELLGAHGITSSLSEPRHHCRCGRSFLIDITAQEPYRAPAAHITEVTRAAGHAAAALLAVFRNKGTDIPAVFADMLREIADAD